VIDAKEPKDMEEELVNMEKEKGENGPCNEELKEKEIELTQQLEHRLASIEEAVKRPRSTSPLKPRMPK
jgi:hypothetical protein